MGQMRVNSLVQHLENWKVGLKVDRKGLNSASHSEKTKAICLKVLDLAYLSPPPHNGVNHAVLVEHMYRCNHLRISLRPQPLRKSSHNHYCCTMRLHLCPSCT